MPHPGKPPTCSLARPPLHAGVHAEADNDESTTSMKMPHAVTDSGLQAVVPKTSCIRTTRAHKHMFADESCDSTYCTSQLWSASEFLL